MVDALDPSNPSDAAVIDELKTVFGDYFGEKISQDAAWSRTILGPVATA